MEYATQIDFLELKARFEQLEREHLALKEEFRRRVLGPQEELARFERDLRKADCSSAGAHSTTIRRQIAEGETEPGGFDNEPEDETA